MANTVIVEENGVTIVAETSTTNVTVSSFGVQGTQGPQGEDYEQDFETVSKNLKSWDATFSYTGPQLTSISYTDGADTIVKTFNYTGSQLTSIVLSGDTPSGIELTKTLSYSGDTLTGVAYS